MTSICHIRSTEDRYLDAAREAILAVGWSRTTLTDIARRAGVSRMTLYRRWPDTRTLLADLMTREWRELLEPLLDPLSPEGPDGPDGPDRIADVVVLAVAALREDPLLRRVVEVDPEELLPYLLLRPGRSQEQVATVLAGLLRAGQASGALRDGDPELMAGSLLLAAQGFLLTAGVLARATGDVAAYDEELRALVRGYVAP